MDKSHVWTSLSLQQACLFSLHEVVQFLLNSPKQPVLSALASPGSVPMSVSHPSSPPASLSSPLGRRWWGRVWRWRRSRVSFNFFLLLLLLATYRCLVVDRHEKVRSAVMSPINRLIGVKNTSWLDLPKFNIIG